MVALGSLAVIAFVCYFAVVVGVLTLTPFMYRLASLALDAGLVLALLTIIAAHLQRGSIARADRRSSYAQSLG